MKMSSCQIPHSEQNKKLGVKQQHYLYPYLFSTENTPLSLYFWIYTGTGCGLFSPPLLCPGSFYSTLFNSWTTCLLEISDMLSIFCLMWLSKQANSIFLKSRHGYLYSTTVSIEQDFYLIFFTFWVCYNPERSESFAGQVAYKTAVLPKWGTLWRIPLLCCMIFWKHFLFHKFDYIMIMYWKYGFRNMVLFRSSIMQCCFGANN